MMWTVLADGSEVIVFLHLLVNQFFVFLLGYDVIAQAQSGTGKTATFAISILQQIDVELKETQALVLAPTRELAQQVRYYQMSKL